VKVLSKEVKVEIYGSLNEKSGVYSGYISGTDNQGQSVYVLSRRPVGDFVYGVVTALINQGETNEKYVVTQKQEIMYEPEIRQRLSAVKSLKIEKLSCLYEKSCGAVILYKEKGEDEASILLVKNQKGRFWSFPKGHVELWENEKETAVREIKRKLTLTWRFLIISVKFQIIAPSAKSARGLCSSLQLPKATRLKFRSRR